MGKSGYFGSYLYKNSETFVIFGKNFHPTP